MNKIFLEEILEVLISVRQELSKHAEGSVNLELDRVIEVLKGEVEKDISINANDVLVLLGKALDKVPAILRLIELWSKLT